ncbi:MAG: hypothetical protein A4E49_02731 [Methanosaeta sp. PtaU1.Bin112]|nr:MAG: hypothetical protein A4E49_02731 [Methanosaeta sp. PtaU1.Bin112]
MQLQTMAASHGSRDGNRDQLYGPCIQRGASLDGVVMKDFGDEDLWAVLHELKYVGDLAISSLN